MTNSAIQSDVEKEVPQAVSARNEAMAALAERTRQARDEEIQESGGEVIDTLNIESEEVEEPKDEVEELVEEVKEEVKEEKPEPVVEVVKIKVDGEEREVPKEKILDAGIRALQKESTADKRLEEATRLLREIEQKYVQPQEKKQETPSQWDDATVAYALEHGTEEQKAYAVSQLRGRGDTTQDIEVIEQRAVSKALDTVDFRDASQWFQTEYKDIVSDPYLFQLAALAEDRAIANGDSRSRKELYKSIGDDLRKWKGGTTVTNTLAEKKEQKSNIVNLPSASVKKSTPAEAKPKSTSDVIEEMRKKRGQR